MTEDVRLAKVIKVSLVEVAQHTHPAGQVVHGDVHSARNSSSREFPGRPHIKHEQICRAAVQLLLELVHCHFPEACAASAGSADSSMTRVLRGCDDHIVIGAAEDRAELGGTGIVAPSCLVAQV